MYILYISYICALVYTYKYKCILYMLYQPCTSQQLTSNDIQIIRWWCVIKVKNVLNIDTRVWSCCARSAPCLQVTSASVSEPLHRPCEHLEDPPQLVGCKDVATWLGDDACFFWVCWDITRCLQIYFSKTQFDYLLLFICILWFMINVTKSIVRFNGVLQMCCTEYLFLTGR